MRKQNFGRLCFFCQFILCRICSSYVFFCTVFHAVRSHCVFGMAYFTFIFNWRHTRQVTQIQIEVKILKLFDQFVSVIFIFLRSFARHLAVHLFQSYMRSYRYRFIYKYVNFGRQKKRICLMHAWIYRILLSLFSSLSLSLFRKNGVLGKLWRVRAVCVCVWCWKWPHKY